MQKDIAIIGWRVNFLIGKDSYCAVKHECETIE